MAEGFKGADDLVDAAALRSTATPHSRKPGGVTDRGIVLKGWWRRRFVAAAPSARVKTAKWPRGVSSSSFSLVVVMGRPWTALQKDGVVGPDERVVNFTYFFGFVFTTTRSPQSNLFRSTVFESSRQRQANTKTP